MKIDKFKTIYSAYILSGIIAFGHCASSYSCGVGDSNADCNQMTAGAAVMAALMGPLYWSWVAFE